MPSRFSCGLPLVLTKMLIYETERLTIAYTPIAGPPDVETAYLARSSSPIGAARGNTCSSGRGVITKWGERFTMRRHAHERPSGESRNDMESWLHREYARGVLDRRAAIR